MSTINDAIMHLSMLYSALDSLGLAGERDRELPSWLDLSLMYYKWLLLENEWFWTLLLKNWAKKSKLIWVNNDYGLSYGWKASPINLAAGGIGGDHVSYSLRDSPTGPSTTSSTWEPLLLLLEDMCLTTKMSSVVGLLVPLHVVRMLEVATPKEWIVRAKGIVAKASSSSTKEVLHVHESIPLHVWKGSIF